MCRPHLACPHRTQSNYRSHWIRKRPRRQFYSFKAKTINSWPLKWWNGEFASFGIWAEIRRRWRIRWKFTKRIRCTMRPGITSRRIERWIWAAWMCDRWATAATRTHRRSNRQPWPRPRNQISHVSLLCRTIACGLVAFRRIFGRANCLPTMLDWVWCWIKCTSTKNKSGCGISRTARVSVVERCWAHMRMPTVWTRAISTDKAMPLWQRNGRNRIGKISLHFKWHSRRWTKTHYSFWQSTKKM